MTELLPCPFCGNPAVWIGVYSGADCIACGECEALMGGEEYAGSKQALITAWNRRAPVAAPAAAKPSTCCPGEHLVPMHSTDTKLCTGCKTEKHWPLEPGQKRTY